MNLSNTTSAKTPEEKVQILTRVIEYRNTDLANKDILLQEKDRLLQDKEEELKEAYERVQDAENRVVQAEEENKECTFISTVISPSPIIGRPPRYAFANRKQ
jgi:biopolymer transport protein ExbB/TolQ